MGFKDLETFHSGPTVTDEMDAGSGESVLVDGRWLPVGDGRVTLKVSRLSSRLPFPSLAQSARSSSMEILVYPWDPELSV